MAPRLRAALRHGGADYRGSYMGFGMVIEAAAGALRGSGGRVLYPRVWEHQPPSTSMRTSREKLIDSSRKIHPYFARQRSNTFCPVFSPIPLTATSSSNEALTIP